MFCNPNTQEAKTGKSERKASFRSTLWNPVSNTTQHKTKSKSYSWAVYEVWGRKRNQSCLLGLCSEATGEWGRLKATGEWGRLRKDLEQGFGSCCVWSVIRLQVETVSRGLLQSDCQRKHLWPLPERWGQSQSLDEVVHKEMLMEALGVPPRIRDRRKDPVEETEGGSLMKQQTTHESLTSRKTRKWFNINPIKGSMVYLY